ncbi:hypothetical protein Tco_1058422 [Tanacetum coccineum]|uniref:Uncharacterized protein n=1 Tax=Tanacetum coccineum TaxID=301880 RepID=A0ABQ5H873_9ASTR
MPPRMRTRSAGRLVAESLGGGTSVRVGRSGRGRRPREGNDERVDDLSGQGNDQEWESNGGECWECDSKRQPGWLFIYGFLACNLRNLNGKGGVVALTRWIEKMESVQI